MAGNGDTNGNLDAHSESYGRFIGWLKIGSIVAAIVVALVLFLITR